MTDLHDEALLTPDQVAEFFRERGMVISSDRVREQIDAGAIPGYRVGRWYVTPLPWMKRWLNGPGSDVATVPANTATPIPFLARKAVAS